jgi:hypothetical protein
MSDAKQEPRRATLPLDHGEVVMMWPSEINPDEIADLEAWIVLITHKIKRHAQPKAFEGRS